MVPREQRKTGLSRTKPEFFVELSRKKNQIYFLSKTEMKRILKLNMHMKRGMTDIQRLSTILEEYSTRKYHIEYDGFLSNHLAHGVIALEKLGADSKQIGDFVQRYQKKLEPAREEQHDIKSNKDERVAALLGKHEGYNELFQYYESCVKQVGIEKAVRSNIALLAKGMAGSALHGMIHLGYAVNAKHTTLVSEGLAYTHFSHVDIVGKVEEDMTVCSDFATFLDSISEAITNSQEDQVLRNLVDGASEQFKDLKTSTFQRKVLALGCPTGQEALARCFGKVPRPADMAWFVDIALFLFIRTARRESSDFFLLHGVTCSWAVWQVAQVTAGDTHNETSLCKSLLHTLGAAYVAQGCPELAAETSTSEMSSWESILGDALLQTDADEHVYKLVQVAHERSSSGCLSQDDYKLAARIVLDRSFHFI